MPNYSNRERTDMVIVYGIAGENAERARRIYMERFPQRQIPSAPTFIHVIQHLRDYGTFKAQIQDRGRYRSERILNVEPQILNTVEDEPGISTRRLALRHEVSQSTVWRTLREQGLHPFHVQKVQALQPGDYERRVTFCQWILEKVNERPNFLNYLLATDEAGFTRDGVTNSHNTHVWCDVNPHAFREDRHQHRFSINVWAGLVNDRLLGPHILPNRLTAIHYLNFLNNHLDDHLDDVPLNIRRDMWYLQDGAPPHSAQIVRTWLDNNFPQKWIGRNGPVPWPARSPDLNPCDFYLWGHMKQLVYSVPINTVEQLRGRIEDAREIIGGNRQILGSLQHSLLRRVHACIENGGGHFEHLL